MATGLEKVRFHSNPKKGNAKECSNYHTIVLISHASKVMLKILQARLQQYMNDELPDVQAGFRKGKRYDERMNNTWWGKERGREIHIDKVKMKVLVAHSCLTPCNPMDCSPPSSSVPGILQVRILE